MVADAQVADLGTYFVGDRVRVWINAGTRPGFVVPASFLVTRFGLDYVRLRRADGSVNETPVQRGIAQPTQARDRSRRAGWRWKSCPAVTRRRRAGGMPNDMTWASPAG